MKHFIIAMFWLLFGSAGAQNFINGNFNSNTPSGLFACNTAPWAWSASPAFGSNPAGVQWESQWNSSWWIDLTDCGWGPGRWIEQTVATTPGQKYYLSFDLGANQWAYADLDLYLNGVFEHKFVQMNDGVTPLRWRTFHYCFVADSSSTAFRFEVAGAYNAPVVGFDNANLSTTMPVTGLFASDTCVPALLTHYGLYGGTTNWFRGGFPIASNKDTIYGRLPGKYTMQYITTCGDTIVRDTVLVDCDTCDSKMKARYFCLGDSTEFTFNPWDDCIDSSCIGDMNIQYGDGSGDNNPFGKARFLHKYAAAGQYYVTYCWTNLCLGQQICDTIEVIITDSCGPCEVDMNFKWKGCNPIQFKLPKSNHHIISAHWDFGDGQMSDLFNPLHMFPGPGTYVVCVTVTTRGPNGELCTFVVCQEITIKPCGDKGAGGDDGGPKGRAYALTGISQAAMDAAITLFPNPAAGRVTLTGLPKTEATVSLYDISGRLVKVEMTHRQTTLSVDLTGLDRGSYLVEISSSGLKARRKLIIE
jgi:hypothetical protein